MISDKTVLIIKAIISEDIEKLRDLIFLGIFVTQFIPPKIPLY